MLGWRDGCRWLRRQLAIPHATGMAAAALPKGRFSSSRDNLNRCGSVDRPVHNVCLSQSPCRASPYRIGRWWRWVRPGGEGGPGGGGTAVAVRPLPPPLPVPSPPHASVLSGTLAHPTRRRWFGPPDRGMCVNQLPLCTAAAAGDTAQREPGSLVAGLPPAGGGAEWWGGRGRRCATSRPAVLLSVAARPTPDPARPPSCRGVTRLLDDDCRLPVTVMRR